MFSDMNLSWNQFCEKTLKDREKVKKQNFINFIENKVFLPTVQPR